MPNKFDKIANDAANETDNQFRSQFNNLTRLNDDDTNKIINESGISQQDLAQVLKEIKDATKSNEEKATAISNINGGVSALIGIAKKLL